MAPKSMELKISSCKDLKAFNFFQKLSVYATVSIVSRPEADQKKKTTQAQRYQLQKTPVDKEGDGNPEWNHQIQFGFNEFSSSSLNTLFLEFDLLCEALFGDKTIGQVRIPIKELLDDSMGGAVRFVSYQVVTTDGKPNGVLDFSYKVIDDRVYYPVIEVPSDGYYNQPPVTSGVCYPPPQGVYPPLPDMTYYPPLPPPYASVYPPPPTPYGSALGDYNYNCQACLYPTVDPFPPYSDDTWRRDLQSWNVSQMR